MAGGGGAGSPGRPAPAEFGPVASGGTPVHQRRGRQPGSGPASVLEGNGRLARSNCAVFRGSHRGATRRPRASGCAASCGATNSRGQGFKHDPASWEAYIELLDKLLGEPLGRRVADEQTELAMRYAYRFFFESPFPFPWNEIGFWRDMEARPLEDVVRDMRDSPYAQTMDALLGRPIAWSRKAG